MADNSADAARSPLWSLAKRVLPPLILVAALGLAGWAIHNELSAIDLADVRRAYNGLPAHTLWLAGLLVALSYVTLIGYDWAAFRYLKLPTPPGRLALGSFCGYAVANTAGFAVITGASARHRIHIDGGLSFFDAGRVALFSSTAFLIGITALGGLGLAAEPGVVGELLRLPPRLVRLMGLGLVGLASLVMIYCALGRPVRIGKRELPMPGFRIAVVQLVLAIVDMCLAGGAMYVLLAVASGDITGGNLGYIEFMSVYCAALAAGLISNVPGGVGIFDAIILKAFAWRIGTAETLAALLAFRVIYYVIPFALAAMALAFVEFSRTTRRGRVPDLSRFSDIADGFAPTVVAVLGVGAGIFMLGLGVTPAGAPRAVLFGNALPGPLVETAHFLGSVVASVLLCLGVGLVRRLDAAHTLTVILLLVLGGLALVKGHSLLTVSGLLAAAVIAWPFGPVFNRRTALLSEPLSPAWIIGIAVVLASAVWLTSFAFSHQVIGDESWYEVALNDDAPRAWRAVIGASVTAILLGVLSLLRRPSRRV